MSKNTRWALAIVGVLIIIVAGVLIGTGRENTDATPVQEPSGDVSEPSGAVSGPSGEAGAGGASGTAGGDSGHGDEGHSHDGTGGASPQEGGSGTDSSGGASPRAETGGAMAEPAVVSPVLVDGKQPTIRASKGDTVMIRARADRPATLHLHGYDKTIELTPGKVGRMRVRAKIDGEFEIAFHYHGSEVHIGKLRISP